MKDKSFDVARRAFIGKVSFAIGGVAITGLMPASILQAAPSISCGALDTCSDWQVDDICNSYPPYSYRVHMANRSVITNSVDSADWHWIS